VIATSGRRSVSAAVRRVPTGPASALRCSSGAASSAHKHRHTTIVTKTSRAEARGGSGGSGALACSRTAIGRSIVCIRGSPQNRK
jgi:hypothetical protein